MDAAMSHHTEFAVDDLATSDERTYATITHLTGLISLPVAIIMWQVKKNESPWLGDHLKEAVNFQISLFIWMLIMGVAAIVTLGLAVIPLLIFTTILRLVGCIRAGVYANKGRYHRYPASWRIIA